MTPILAPGGPDSTPGTIATTAIDRPDGCITTPTSGDRHHVPVFGIDAHGSAGAKASPR